MEQTTPEARPRRRWRVVVWISVAVLLIVAAAGAWVATRVLAVRDDLSAVAALENRAQEALKTGDTAALTEIVAEVEDHAASAVDESNDPLWRFAEVLPGLGPNLSAARMVAEQVSSLSSEVASPLVAVMNDLGDRELMAGGAIDVSVIQHVREPVLSAARAVAASQTAVKGQPREQLIGEVADGVDDLASLTQSLSVTVDALDDLTAVVPGILGADGPRSILVMFQNNAELRSGGGITGSFAEFTVDAGAITLTRQADSSDFDPVDDDLVAIPSTTAKVYGDSVGRFVQNTTSTPDFDLSARLASAWWEKLTGREPDVVVSMDPLVLRSLLAVTGPVDLAGGAQLTRDDFVRDVMIDPYFKLEFSEQSDYFADLTDRFFSALMTSSATPSAWIEALRAPLEQGRISVWSAHDTESSVLAETAVAGPRARHLAAGESAFALYFNDSTGAKMDSRLRVAAGTAVGSCRSDGRVEVAVRVSLSSDAPDDAGTRWPVSMTGGGHWGVTPGDIATVVTVVSPPEWFFGGTRSEGALLGAIDVIDEGLPTSAVEVTLEPGETTQLEMRFIAPREGDIEPQLLHTPLLRAIEEIESRPLGCN